MSRFSLVALAVALALTGCQKSLTEKDFAGKLTGHISMADADIAKIQK